MDNESTDPSASIAGLLKKVSDAQRDIMKCDWAPDKAYSVGGSIVRYCTLTKMKGNIAPILQAHGLVLGIAVDKMRELPAAGKLAQHFAVRMQVSLYDTDTGASMTDVVWGESGDTGDKALTKAESFAFKQWLSTKFMITDGFDIEDELPESKGFTKRSEAETEELKSKVLGNAEKPAEKPTEKPAEKPAERPVESPQEPVVEEEVPEPEPEPEVPQEPAEEPKKPSEKETKNENNPIPNVEGYKLEGPQAKAINKILADWEKRAKEGKIPVEQYNEMSADVVSIASPADAVAFIKKYRGL